MAKLSTDVELSFGKPIVDRRWNPLNNIIESIPQQTLNVWPLSSCHDKRWIIVITSSFKGTILLGMWNVGLRNLKPWTWWAGLVCGSSRVRIPKAG